MLKKILPLVLLLIGSGVGAAVGLYVRPEPPEESEPASTETEQVEDAPASAEEQSTDFEYVRMNNQFVVPVVSGEQVQALVVLSLSLEIGSGQQEVIYAREPKLRDSFLQVLFDHANAGGFNGAFTNANNLAVLRQALREVAQKDVGDVVSDVLIVEIARQDY